MTWDGNSERGKRVLAPHEFLTLTRPFIVPDVETTSLNAEEARIIELGYQVWNVNGLTAEFRTYVRPGIPIPPETTAVHGISDTTMLGCQLCGRIELEHPYRLKQQGVEECFEFKPIPILAQLAAKLAHDFSDCDFGGKNIRYDLRVLAASFKRVGVKWNYTGAYVIDADRLEHLGEPRTLEHLYLKHTGKELKGAHGALTDARASSELIACQLAHNPSVLPRDLAALHQLQWPGWVDTEGKFRTGEDGLTRCGFGKHRDKTMQEITRIDRSYWDWIIKAEFPADVKKLAMDAKMGKYPEGVK